MIEYKRQQQIDMGNNGVPDAQNLSNGEVGTLEREAHIQHVTDLQDQKVSHGCASVVVRWYSREFVLISLGRVR